MKLDVSQVKHAAKLANLTLTPAEEKQYAKQLTKILEYVEQLKTVNTSEVESTFNVQGRKSIMRKDATQASMSQEDALANAPQQKNGFFVTKGVFEE